MKRLKFGVVVLIIITIFSACTMDIQGMSDDLDQLNKDADELNGLIDEYNESIRNNVTIINKTSWAVGVDITDDKTINEQVRAEPYETNSWNKTYLKTTGEEFHIWGATCPPYQYDKKIYFNDTFQTVSRATLIITLTMGEGDETPTILIVYK